MIITMLLNILLLPITSIILLSHVLCEGQDFLQAYLSLKEYEWGLRSLHDIDISSARRHLKSSYELFPYLHTRILLAAIDDLLVQGQYSDYLLDNQVVTKDILEADRYLEAGVQLSKEGSHMTAVSMLLKGAELNRLDSQLWFNLGVSYANLGQLYEAVEAYRTALLYNPLHTISLLNLGSLFQSYGDIHQALPYYEHLVNIFVESKKMMGEHIVHYDYFRVQGNLAMIWYQIELVEKALNLTSSTYAEIIRTLSNAGYNVDSLLSPQRTAMDLLPVVQAYYTHISYLLLIRRTALIWKDREVLLHKLLFYTLGKAGEGKIAPLLPFDSLLYEVSLAHRLTISKVTSQNYNAYKGAVNSVYSEDQELIVGLVTADMGHHHPTTVLLEGLLQLISALNSTFTIMNTKFIVYNIGPIDHDSTYRQSILNLAHDFIDIPLSFSLVQKMKLLYGPHNLDIILDMQLHTLGSQTALIAAHPHQIVAMNYLVYPGTSGSSFLDYLMADQVVMPVEHARYYSEKFIYLPASYQVASYGEYMNSKSTDIEKLIRVDTGSGLETLVDAKRSLRRLYGLPEEAIVLCNFNKIDKIDPVSFQIWMQIMTRAPNSVLWLLQPSAITSTTLTNHTHEISFTEQQIKLSLSHYGISHHRLFFAKRVNKYDHIYRHLAADLFVDTFTYSAHSTATDALFGGVSILTISGDSFPNRVGQSLLRGLFQRDSVKNLGDLLTTHTKQEFEDHAVMLLQNLLVLHHLQLSVLQYLYTSFVTVRKEQLKTDVLYGKSILIAMQAAKDIKNMSQIYVKYVNTMYHLSITV